MNYQEFQKMKDEKISDLTAGELDEVFFRAMVSANARLFKGIVPILDTLNDKLNTISEDIEYLKAATNYKAHKKLEKKLSLREQQIKDVVSLLGKVSVDET